MDKKFSEQYDPKYDLTQEELLENLDRNYVHRDGIHTISDSFAHNQIKEMIQQKLTVRRKEIESAIFAGRNWDDGKFYDKDGIEAVTELFKSKDFTVED